jgi:hypothetical protein
VPWFEFTIVTRGVDLLDEANLDAIDQYNAGFLDDPPLEPTLMPEGDGWKAIFSVEAERYAAAVDSAVGALREVFPTIEIVAVTAGRHPGDMDIV